MTENPVRHIRTLIARRLPAPLAALLRLQDELAGKKVALILSGGNISPEQLRTVLERGG